MRRHGAFLILPLLLAACVSWRGHGEAAEATLASGHVDVARVTMKDGNVVILRAPRAVGDSIVGYRDVVADSTRFAVAARDIRLIETREPDYWRSAGLTFGVVSALLFAATVALIVMVVQAAGG